eukprot:7194507-Ditylum_brightwellii.AAC.1
MRVPRKKHGELGHCVRPRSTRIFLDFSYQCRGLQRRPYNVLRRRKYVFLGVSGHPGGGLIMYCSLVGRVDWQKACFTSMFKSILLSLTRWETRSRVLIETLPVCSTPLWSRNRDQDCQCCDGHGWDV